jgi:hypothetical protein
MALEPANFSNELDVRLAASDELGEAANRKCRCQRHWITHDR